MPDDLESIFDEVVATDSEVVVDNPDGTDVEDTGADETSAFEEILDDEDSDTPVGEPDADVVDDDFDWNEIVARYGDREIPLLVDGVEVKKPLKDLPSMAMMREDYSRKTAEVAQDKRAAQWAQDVQQSFERDPAGTLKAFAEAYGIQGNAQPPTQTAAVDPYEDFDPEIAAVLRKMDEQEQRHQAELEAVKRQTASLTDQQIRAEVQAEFEAVKAFYGDDLDPVEMLGVAQQFQMTLADAAEFVVGRKLLAQSKVASQAGATAAKVAADRETSERKASKRRATGAATPAFNAGGVLDDNDFDSISELYELVASSTTS
jgi:hypothetical protein